MFLNSDNRLFVVDRNGEKQYISCLALRKLTKHFSIAATPTFKVILSGPLPDSKLLLSDYQGVEFHVISEKCEDPTQYNADAVIMIILNCYPVESWIDDLVICKPGDEELVCACTKMECNVIFQLENLK